MARQSNKLTTAGIKAMSKPGFYSDGNGLYLQVSQSGSKSFVFRYQRHGKRHAMGLGAFPVPTSLAKARETAIEARKTLQEGLDPLDAKNARVAAEKLRLARSLTFDQCADAYISAKKPEWSNPKHAQQVTNTLKHYVSPKFGSVAVADVNLDLVLSALEPIWQTKTETASRVRQRIEQVLAWAKTKGYRTGDNPAEWKGNLDKVLASPKKAKPVKHHPALSIDEVPSFMDALRKEKGTSPLALEFCILTATRTSETRLAEWTEFDLSAALWTIPADRMKAKRPHQVPLSGRCIELLKEMQKHSGAYVFPGMKADHPLSNNAFLATLERMGRGDITTHGFRSTFRDWCSEKTSHSHAVAEMALAHTIGNAVEAAYRRGDLLEKRKILMQDWADYCNQGQTA